MTSGPNPISGPSASVAHRAYSPGKQKALEFAERQAQKREDWIAQQSFFFEEDWRYLKFLVPPGKRVLDLGCGTGALLNALEPSYGVGIDFSHAMIERAQAAHPHLNFLHGDIETLDEIAGLTGTFDIIVMSDTVGALDDC